MGRGEETRPGRRDRLHSNRITKPFRIQLLIGCGAKETEPNYLNGLKIWLEEHNYHPPKIQIEPCGRTTVSLVEKFNRIAIERAGKKPYESIYVALDYDGYVDFDDAIALAKKYHFIPIWSNWCIEFWFVLHFKYQTTELTADQLCTLLSFEFNKNGYQQGYSKTDDKIAWMLMERVDKAIHNAEAIRERNGDKNPSQCRPGTNMDILVKRILEEAGCNLKSY